MKDNGETTEHVKELEDLLKQSALPKIKMCCVKLEKLNLPDFLFHDSDSSDDDLPPVSCLLGKYNKEKNHEKSNKELLEEHENLAKNIQNSSNNNIEEKLKTIQLVNTDEVEKVPLSPPTTENGEEDIKVILTNDNLQFFNMCDVTLEQCGYNCSSADLTEYEKTMLKFKRVELERVLSSFLFSCNVYCISDIKSFVTFLLRNLSVHSDVANIEACYNVLYSILEKHPHSKSVNFSSAEIFMLLFNYGIDISSFKFLKKQMGIQKYLEEPKDKSRSKIPENWTFNLKITLKAIVVLITNCEFKLKHLCDVIIYFLWLSLDSKLMNENIFSIVRECIDVALENVPADKWSKVMREIACAFITEDFLYSQDQWRIVYQIAESVPVTSKKGLELRKYISFLALTQFGKTEFTKGSPRETAEMNKTLNGFSLGELQSFLERLIRNGSDAVINIAAKFLNLCISHLEANDEDMKELCNILKYSESVLSERAHEAKAHFLKIHARLRIKHGKSSMYEITPEEHGVLRKKIKKEVDVDSVPSLSYPLLKVKEEPMQECTPFMMDHISEKIISFSEFDCENDEEMDFSDVDESDGSGAIHMDVVPDAVKIEQISAALITGSNESDDSIKSKPFSPSSSSCDTFDEKYDNTSKSPSGDFMENCNISLKNSTTINSPPLKTVTPVSSDHDLPSSVDLNQSKNIDNFDINGELVISRQKSSDEPVSLPLPYESNSSLPDDFVNNQMLSHCNAVSSFVTADSECELKKDVISKDLLINAKTVSHVAVSTGSHGDTCEIISESFNHNGKLSLSDQLSVNESELPVENNNRNQNSSFLDNKVNDSYVAILPPSISVTPITGDLEIINQSDQVELLQSDLSSSHNIKSTSNNLTKVLIKTSSQLDSEEGLGISSSINSFNDISNHSEQGDSQFNLEAENCPTPLTDLAKLLPEGTEILPVKKKIDSPLPGPSNQNADVCKNIENDKDVVFISEKNLLLKGKKKQNEKVDVETIESDGSDKELQILFVKTTLRGKSSSSKSFKGRSESLENKTIYDIDDEITVVTDNLNISQTCLNSSQSQSSCLTDSYSSVVNNKNIAVSRKDVLLSANVDSKDVESCSETVTNAINIPLNSLAISNSNGDVIEHLNFPSKELCTSECNKTVMSCNETITNTINIPVNPHAISNNNGDVFEHLDLPSKELCMSESNNNSDIINTEFIENNIQCNIDLEDAIVNYMTTVVVEARSAVNKVISEKFPEVHKDFQPTGANEQEFSMDTQSIDAEVPIKDGNILEFSMDTQSIDAEVPNKDGNILEETAAIINSIKKTSLQEDDKLNTDRNSLIDNTQSMEVQSTLNSVEKVNLKRKSINNHSNLLHSHSTEHDIDTDVSLVLNDLLESSSQRLSEDHACELSQCTSTSNIVTQFNSSSTLPLLSGVTLPHLMTEEPDFGSQNSVEQSIPVQVEAEEADSVCSQSIRTNLVADDRSENNIQNSVTLSMGKSCPEYNIPEGSNQKSVQSKCKSHAELSIRVSNSQSVKRKNTHFPSSLSKSQNLGDERTPSSSKKLNKSKTSTSPLKSCANMTSIKNRNSPKKYFDYQQKRSNYTNFKKQKNYLLTQTGQKLSTTLRAKLLSDCSEQIPSSSKEEVIESSDSDSDIMVLNCDPKNYADHECMVIFDSHNCIVLDSD